MTDDDIVRFAGLRLKRNAAVGEIIRQAGADTDHAVPRLEAEKLLGKDSEIPARRAGIPCPAGLTGMTGAGVNICRDDKRLGHIAVQIMVFRQKAFEYRHAVICPAALKAGLREPQRRVGVLPAVFSEAGSVAADIAGIAYAAEKRRVKELDYAVFAVEQQPERASSAVPAFAFDASEQKQAQLCAMESMRQHSF